MPTRWHSPSSASFDGESPGSEANCWELQSWRKLTWNRNSSEVDSSWFCTFLFPFSFFTANDCNKSLLVPLWSRRNFKDRSPSLNVHVESSMPNANFFTQMYTNVTVDVLSFYMFRYMHLHILNTMYCTWSCGYVFTVMILTRAVQTHTHTHATHCKFTYFFHYNIYIYNLFFLVFVWAKMLPELQALGAEAKAPASLTGLCKLSEQERKDSRIPKWIFNGPPKTSLHKWNDTIVFEGDATRQTSLCWVQPCCNKQLR